MKASSQTTDEPLHLAAGYSYWKLNDFRLNKEHPPLIKELAAIPLLFLNLRFPNSKSWDEGDQVNLGRRFLFEQRELMIEQQGRDGPFVPSDKILFSARLPVLILSLVLGWFLFRWSREMFGAAAALLTLALYVLDPNVITHSCLVTTDLGVTLFMFLAVYALWKYIEKPRPLRIIWLGLMIGAAFASKFTSLWVLPILGLLALFLVYAKAPLPARPWSAKSEPASGRSRRFASITAVLAIALAVGFLMLLATYFAVNFPAYFQGMREGIGHASSGHEAYLLGEISQHG
jgi:dolichyl-phosphate-mannose--protein O-mannosyl transferase